jgi:hypothetical protein
LNELLIATTQPLGKKILNEATADRNHRIPIAI